MDKPPKLTPKQLGQKIRSLREELDISQEDLAENLKVTRQAIGQIEKGERKIDTLELVKLASFFSVSIDDLLKPALMRQPSHLSKQSQPTFGGYAFNPVKLRNLLLYILEKCGGKPNIGETVLYKLFYFIDFEAVELLGHPLTGMTYVKLQYGPVPRKIEYNKVIIPMIENGELKIFSHEFYGKPQKRYVALCEPDVEVFTRQEEELINRNLNQLSDMKAAEITHYVHGDVPWKTTEDNEVIDYHLAFQRELPYSKVDYTLLQENVSSHDILEQLGPISKEESDYYGNL